jgi:hypothetical protein
MIQQENRLFQCILDYYKKLESLRYGLVTI